MSNKYMHYAYFETTNIFKKLQERGYKIQNCLLVECSLSLRWKMNSTWQRLEKTLATFDFFDSWKFHNKMCLLPITVALTSPTRSIEDFFCSGEIHSKIYRVLHFFIHFEKGPLSKIIQEGLSIMVHLIGAKLSRRVLVCPLFKVRKLPWSWKIFRPKIRLIRWCASCLAHKTNSRIFISCKYIGWKTLSIAHATSMALSLVGYII